MKFINLAAVLMATALSAFAQKNTYILVHGAWHGAWCWKKVVPLLESRGHRAIALDLPGHGEDQRDIGDVTFQDYVDKVVVVSNATSEKVILVGHSMAGVVIAQAAEALGPKKVTKLIFLDAFMPQTGESVFLLAEKASTIGDQRPPLLASLVLSADQKTSTVKAEAIEPLFYHDCSPEDVAYAKKHVGGQAMACLGTPVTVTEERYGSIPKRYILCTQAKDLDKTAIATNVPVEKLFKLESSHSPFFSMPDSLAELLMK